MIPLAIAGIALIFKDYSLALAAAILSALQFIGTETVITHIQKYSFHLGIFFLMLFLLVPLTNDKLNGWDMLKQTLSPMGVVAITAGFIISYLGGKGLGVLSARPVMFFGIILGTLIAVLFFRGLPAGIIIAAGLLSLISITSS